MNNKNNKSGPNNISNTETLFAGQQNQQKSNYTTFAQYQIQGELGRGGMGVVYKALDTKLNMLVALKIIITENVRSIERFKREASATAKLAHPNIIRFYNFGEFPRPYFTMEYIEGHTLDYLIKEKQISPQQLVDLMIVVCDALAYAHENKMFHRDLKPSNIMITKDGVPKIMDFGLVKIETNAQKISKTGQILGTMNYMAPEQANGKGTYKSDIYSIGATIYKALTYNNVFQADSHPSLIHQILNKDPIPPREINPDISPYIEAICLKCLQKNPNKRYDDFKQLSQEIKNFKLGRPIVAREYTSFDIFKNFTSKHKIICVNILLAFVILCVSLGMTIRTSNYAHKQKNKAYKALKIARNALQAKKQINENLQQEKQKTDKANKDLKALNKAIIKSLQYARVANNYKYNPLFFDKKFLDPVRKVFEQSVTLQTVQEYTFLRGIVLGQSKKKQNIAQAIKDFTKEIQKNPQDAVVYNNRGNAYKKRGGAV